jgi:UDP-N-acetylglucosamine--N-acetylmuramyl-(pentapeptide) pyrophosphoryl-undecaprenol N-acetylglucosamine transferase
MGKRIVIMAGGTGGHVFPALAVAKFLMDKDWQLSWLGTQKGIESRVVPENGIEIDWLSVSGVRGKGLVSKIHSFINLFKACIQAYKILRRRKPAVVLGMGGFVAGPGGLMAWLLGIPLIIHEQNRIPGSTNKILARFATKVLEAFPKSFAPDKKAQCTGNPLRKELLNLPDRIFPENRNVHPLRLLIIGGSQGAKILNEIVPLAVAKLSDIEVWHQCGQVMQDEVEQLYQSTNANARVTAFIEDMASAYQWADLMICRAGAMTVSEVSALGIPAIFIPLPGAIDNHQMVNAQYLTENAAAWLLPQNELSPETLAELINSSASNLETTANNAKRLAVLEATELVANYCIAEAK